MRIGLALGGGGAKGIAHIPILETFDEVGLRPAAISGASIGAVVGAAYASGMSGAELREQIEDQLFSAAEPRWERRFDLARNFRRILDLIDLDFGSGGFVHGEKVIELLYEGLRVRRFEDLDIPLKVVATEFWKREQVVFERGDLLPAVRASMSLPVLFNPVVIDDRVLMDGGAVNPVPYDLLLDDCDAVVAVDVSGQRSRGSGAQRPSLPQAIFNTFQIMSKAILDAKVARRPPDLLLRPDLVDVQLLEFDRAQEIYAQAVPAARELRDWLSERLAGPSGR